MTRTLSLLFASFALSTAASAADVYWTTPDVNMTISNGTAVDFAFWYEVDTGGGSLVLRDRVCQNPAGPAFDCFTQILANPASAGAGVVGFGVDPGGYNIGTNHYSFTLTLGVGPSAPTDTLEVTVLVTP